MWLVLGLVLAGAVAVGLARHRSSPAALQASPSIGAVSRSPVRTNVSTGATPRPSATPAPAGRRIPKPAITWDPIPFPASRKRETAAYAQEHYGIDSWRLVHPHVIVEHYTASTTFQSAWDAFAVDRPDPEFHSLPADCAHFVIDTDGTIHQLVPLTIMCRHTVGLNWTAVGIEMVGTSDRQILADRAERRSAVHLTAWLMQRLHIQLRNVIGHNESLDSPYHHELVAAWRCQTHQDWQHADMQVLRADIGSYLQRFGVPPGRPWRAHPQAGCG